MPREVDNQKRERRGGKRKEIPIPDHPEQGIYRTIEEDYIERREAVKHNPRLIPLDVTAKEQTECKNYPHRRGNGEQELLGYIREVLDGKERVGMRGPKRIHNRHENRCGTLLLAVARQLIGVEIEYVRECSEDQRGSDR